MPRQVVNLAKTQCTMSVKPSQLLVLPTLRRNAGGQPAATVQDHLPLVNIAPFGPCSSPAFPPTIAAAGVPQQCLPNTLTPWVPGSSVVNISKQPALRQSDTCQCFWGGIISVTDPGQAIVEDA
jgi:hypothetical protein